MASLVQPYFLLSDLFYFTPSKPPISPLPSPVNLAVMLQGCRRAGRLSAIWFLPSVLS